MDPRELHIHHGIPFDQPVQMVTRRLETIRDVLPNSREAGGSKHPLKSPTGAHRQVRDGASEKPHIPQINLWGESLIMIACSALEGKRVQQLTGQDPRCVFYTVPSCCKAAGETPFTYIGPDRPLSHQEETLVIDIVKCLWTVSQSLEGMRSVLKKAYRFQWKRVIAFVRQLLVGNVRPTVNTSKTPLGKSSLFKKLSKR